MLLVLGNIVFMNENPRHEIPQNMNQQIASFRPIRDINQANQSSPSFISKKERPALWIEVAFGFQSLSDPSTF